MDVKTSRTFLEQLIIFFSSSSCSHFFFYLKNNVSTFCIFFFLKTSSFVGNFKKCEYGRTHSSVEIGDKLNIEEQKLIFLIFPHVRLGKEIFFRKLWLNWSQSYRSNLVLEKIRLALNSFTLIKKKYHHNTIIYIKGVTSRH